MSRKIQIVVIAALFCAAWVREAAATQPPDVVQSDSGSDTAMGGYALSSLSSGYQNTAAGYLVLDNITSGYKNAGFGYLVLSTSTSGADNAAFGADTLTSNSGAGSNNSAFGGDALHSLGGGVSYNTAVGSQAAYNSASGVANVAIGANSMYSNTTGESNTIVGYSAYYFGQSGGSNVAVGDSAMLKLDGSSNTAVGFNALLGDGSGTSNVAVGGDALERVQSNNNTGIGYAALVQDSTGSNNTALGYLAGAGPNSGSNNIEIGNQGDGPDEILQSGSIPIDANLTRLGAAQKQAYVAGIYGTSVSGNAVFVNSQGQLGVVVSSQRFKTEIAAMADPDKLSRLRPVTFHLKADPDGPLQYGLIAEEVAKTYPALVIRDEHGRIDGVRYDELAPLLLRKVQSQDMQIHYWQAQLNSIRQLQTQIAETRTALLQLQVKP